MLLLSEQKRSKSCRGFTLLEVMIACFLGSIVLAGVLSAFLMLGRSGQRLYYYNGMESESRRTLEEVAQDVRMASNSVYNSATSITLTVPDNYVTTANQVTYAYGNLTVGAVTINNCFYRRPGDTTSTVTPTILVRNVTGCVFNRYTVLGELITDDTTLFPTPDVSTKRIELNLRISNTRSTLVAATDNIVSATYVLRNK